jgi:hypothetical protein
LKTNFGLLLSACKNYIKLVIEWYHCLHFLLYVGPRI